MPYLRSREDPWYLFVQPWEKFSLNLHLCNLFFCPFHVSDFYTDLLTTFPFHSNSKIPSLSTQIKTEFTAYIFFTWFVRNVELQYYKPKVEKKLPETTTGSIFKEKNNSLFPSQALLPLGIGVATGEMCQNRVMFKQFLKANAMQYCQIDACRLGGVNEVLAVILLAAKFNGLSWTLNWYSFIHRIRIFSFQLIVIKFKYLVVKSQPGLLFTKRIDSKCNFSLYKWIPISLFQFRSVPMQGVWHCVN